MDDDMHAEKRWADRPDLNRCIFALSTPHYQAWGQVCRPLSPGIIRDGLPLLTRSFTRH
jgi:hypothetical protein